jgi:hypothetical protein
LETLSKLSTAPNKKRPKKEENTIVVSNDWKSALPLADFRFLQKTQGELRKIRCFRVSKKRLARLDSVAKWLFFDKPDGLDKGGFQAVDALLLYNFNSIALHAKILEQELYRFEQLKNGQYRVPNQQMMPSSKPRKYSQTLMREEDLESDESLPQGEVETRSDHDLPQQDAWDLDDLVDVAKDSLQELFDEEKIDTLNLDRLADLAYNRFEQITSIVNDDFIRYWTWKQQLDTQRADRLKLICHWLRSHQQYSEDVGSSSSSTTTTTTTAFTANEVQEAEFEYVWQQLNIHSILSMNDCALVMEQRIHDYVEHWGSSWLEQFLDKESLEFEVSLKRYAKRYGADRAKVLDDACLWVADPNSEHDPLREFYLVSYLIPDTGDKTLLDRGKELEQAVHRQRAYLGPNWTDQASVMTMIEIRNSLGKTYHSVVEVDDGETVPPPSSLTITATTTTKKDDVPFMVEISRPGSSLLLSSTTPAPVLSDEDDENGHDRVSCCCVSPTPPSSEEDDECWTRATTTTDGSLPGAIIRSNHKQRWGATDLTSEFSTPTTNTTATTTDQGIYNVDDDDNNNSNTSGGFRWVTVQKLSCQRHHQQQQRDLAPTTLESIAERL